MSKELGVPLNTLIDFATAAASSSVGAVIGTVIKLVKQPPRTFGHWFGEGFIRISVGTLAGGICSEWLHLGPWVASSAAAAAAYIADEILRAVDTNAVRLKNVEPPLPFEKDPPDGNQ